MKLKKRTILRIISLVMLVIAVIFVILVLNCPQCGRTVHIGTFRFGAEVDRRLQALCPGDGGAVRRVVLGKGAVRGHG